jgi:hypothetical protein
MENMKQLITDLIPIWGNAIVDNTGPVVNVSLNDNVILNEALNIEEEFNHNKRSLIKDRVEIKTLIIGEATQSYENFIYNQEGIPKTVFLSKDLKIDANDDSERGVLLRKKLKDSGVLVLDIYPLPLPSFIYGKHEPQGINGHDLKVAMDLLMEYWSLKLDGFNLNIEHVALGFPKLEGRPAWTQCRK